MDKLLVRPYLSQDRFWVRQGRQLRYLVSIPSSFYQSTEGYILMWCLVKDGNTMCQPSYSWCTLQTLHILNAFSSYSGNADIQYLQQKVFPVPSSIQVAYVEHISAQEGWRIRTAIITPKFPISSSPQRTKFSGNHLEVRATGNICTVFHFYLWSYVIQVVIGIYHEGCLMIYAMYFSVMWSCWPLNWDRWCSVECYILLDQIWETSSNAVRAMDHLAE